MIKCCFGCTPETGRSTTCHSTCNKYLEEKEAYEDNKRKARMASCTPIQGYYSDRRATVSRRVSKYYGK